MMAISIGVKGRLVDGFPNAQRAPAAVVRASGAGALSSSLDADGRHGFPPELRC